ncbi:MAG: endonuclease/exonuclease/phosphatase family protein [Pseudonocardiaceae bacterium]
MRIALWSCLQRYEHAAVLVGFTTPEQIEMNLSCLGQPPTGEELSMAREIMNSVQAQLDATGAVFLDESPAADTMTIHSEAQLALLSPAGDAAVTPILNERSDLVRVLTWNVQHAAATPTQQQARWLATACPHDVLVLTEVGAGRLLGRLLGEFGYTVHLPEARDDKYRVLLACRSPVLDMVCETGVDFLPHRCVAARVRLPSIELGVIGLYVPSRGPKDQRNVAKRAFQKAVAAVLPSLTARLNVTGPVVITGDLNVVEPNHDPRYPVFGPWEYDFYRAFGKAGFADAFRITHPSGMDYSWFGRPRGDGRRNGYRFDHTFITTADATTVRDCRYLHDGSR